MFDTLAVTQQTIFAKNLTIDDITELQILEKAFS